MGDDVVTGRTAEQRLAVRQAQSAPLVAELEVWLRAQLDRLSHGSKLAEAIRYGLRHWQGLSEFLSDGRLEMDTFNPQSQGTHPTRRNTLSPAPPHRVDLSRIYAAPITRLGCLAFEGQGAFASQR